MVADWIADLRIINQDLWDKVKARQGDLRIKKKNDTGIWDRRRRKYLRSGLLKCDHCGGGYRRRRSDFAS